MLGSQVVTTSILKTRVAHTIPLGLLKKYGLASSLEIVLSQPCMLRIMFDCLAHCQICHDLLAAAIHGRNFIDAVEGLHDTPHASEGHTAPAQNLHSIVRDLVAHACCG